MKKYLKRWQAGLITFDECYELILENVDLDVMDELYLDEELKQFAINNDISW